MALDKTRIAEGVIGQLEGLGMKPNEVPFLETGKGVLQILVEAIADEIIKEFRENAEITTTHAPGTIVVVGSPTTQSNTAPINNTQGAIQ